MSLLHNKELLGHIVPLDNTLPINKTIGCYHFRFWKLGDWYDVVGEYAFCFLLFIRISLNHKFLVDEHILADMNHNVRFTRNITHPNEFWVCLLVSRKEFRN